MQHRRVLNLSWGLVIMGSTLIPPLPGLAESTQHVDLVGSASDPQVVVTQVFSEAGITIDGTNPWDIQVHHPDFYRRVLADGSLGLGESYMLGWWDSQAVDQTIEKIITARIDEKAPINLQVIWALIQSHLLNLQDRLRSHQVIDAHYQLGNDLYRCMLGPTMAYSCGYWKHASSLDQAQREKFDLIARKLGMKPGMRVLDIGCGWGGFAEYIARHYGVQVVGITLSENQAEVAARRCEGLPVEISVEDYRDVEGTFDRIVEIGMFEHVGRKNYREFFEICHRCLKEDGMMMLHTIGSNVSSSFGDPWIDRYIFPNGQLPSIAQIGSSIEDLFVMEDWHNFGADYDRTLRAWEANFIRCWPQLRDHYPDPFFRMWTYYLNSCAGAFRARSIQLWQVVLSKQGVPDGYTTVR
jgi:cyclopropane-fatty-acyl-phospholipid synthase